MNRIERFSLASLPPGRVIDKSRSRLLLDGRSLCVVDGDEISAQFECSRHFLVVTNFDFYDGTSHFFLLLNEDGRLIDQVSTPDVFGFIQDIATENATVLSFGFYGTTDKWRLVVEASGRWSFLAAELACRPPRFLLAKRRLRLRRA